MLYKLSLLRRILWLTESKAFDKYLKTPKVYLKESDTIFSLFLKSTIKIFMRLNVLFFRRFSTSKCSYFILDFYETFLPVSDEETKKSV